MERNKKMFRFSIHSQNEGQRHPRLLALTNFRDLAEVVKNYALTNKADGSNVYILEHDEANYLGKPVAGNTERSDADN